MRRSRAAAATRFVPVYRPLPSPLHAARAGAAACFCFGLAVVPVLYDNPLVLAATGCATLAAAALAGVLRELGRAARIAVPLALLIALVNPFVSQEGVTVLVRGWEVLGYPLDVTLEALVYGAVVGLRLIVLSFTFALYQAVVDPDEALRLFRRFSYRSALTATLTTRFVPVMARDALRMSDAARCRAEPPARGTVARATLAGALDRAVDVAAALEVRGYASAGQPPRRRRRWSRHDIRVAASAFAIAAVSIAAAAAGTATFDPYPRLHMEAGAPELVLCAALLAFALAPFAGARARLGVAHG